MSLVEETRAERATLNIAATLGGILDDAKRLRDACLDLLEDPEAPGRLWVGPRAEDIDVLYSFVDAQGRRQARREGLPGLIARLETGLGITVEKIHGRQADPRELILKTHASTLSTIETTTGLIERSFELSSKLDAAAKLQALSAEECRRALRAHLVERCGMTDAAFGGLLARIEADALREAEEEAERDDEV